MSLHVDDPPIASTSSAPAWNGYSFKNMTLDEVLEDLSSRFILNLPEEELVSFERISFQVEQAHWYYEDFIREEEPNFPSMALKTFSRQLFHACPLLQPWAHDHDQAFQDFLDYKTSVPVCGVIMLNPTWDKCVLVKGWKSTASWSFPRGKINAEEPDYDCAVREALEETGYDVTSKLIKEAAIRVTIKEQISTMFVIPNVPEDTHFQPMTRKEISKVEWFPLSELPHWKKGVKLPSSNKFYGITPFLAPLRGIVKSLRKSEWERNNAQRAAGSNGGVFENSPQPYSQTPAPPPLDHAIAASSTFVPPSENDHLSRLLGNLTFAPATVPAPSPMAAPTHSQPVTNQVVRDGPLPTPQATPAAANALPRSKAPITHSLPSEISIPPPFATPTPPDTGDSTKLNAAATSSAVAPGLEQQGAEGSTQAPPVKAKFDFVSPFDVFETKKPKRVQERPLASAPKAETFITAQPSESSKTASHSFAPVANGKSDPSSSSTQLPPPPTLTASTSADAPAAPLSPERAQAPSTAAEHFAPASVSRARLRSRGKSITQSPNLLTVSSMIANGVKSHGPTSPLSPAATTALITNLLPNSGPASGTESSPMSVITPDKKAKHTALLQSLASEMMAKSAGSPIIKRAEVPLPSQSVPPPSSLAAPNLYMNGLPPNASISPQGYRQPRPNANLNARVEGATSPQPQNGTNIYYPNPRYATGGGPGSPIPIVPPTNPLQRDQLLSILKAPTGLAGSAPLPPRSVPPPPSHSPSNVYYPHHSPHNQYQYQRQPRQSPPRHLNLNGGGPPRSMSIAPLQYQTLPQSHQAAPSGFGPAPVRAPPFPPQPQPQTNGVPPLGGGSFTSSAMNLLSILKQGPNGNGPSTDDSFASNAFR